MTSGANAETARFSSIFKETVSMTDIAYMVATRRTALRFCLSAWLLNGLYLSPHAVAADELAKKFEFLKENGNSNCSQAFLDSIPSLPDEARLQGSCCAPMDLHRYREQIAGLKRHAAIAEIPPDPYDIEAVLAKRLFRAYDITLKPEQQKAYGEAMALSSEKGPCCCQCWRWHVYGGLGKLLIRDHSFDDAKLARIWDLSDGCGGEDHIH
jgi:hypothetical protein